ncbi:MAG: rod shape-determining protein MreC [Bacillota bacterium]
MLDFLRKNHKLILLILLLVSLIRIINLVGTDKDHNIFARVVIDYVFRPSFVVVNNIKTAINSNLEIIIDYQQVKQENKRLEDEISDLNNQRIKLKKTLDENKRLRELLNFKERVPYQFIGASVIGHSADNWSDVITINRGQKSGIEAKMAVVAKDGYLIGIIKRVTNYTAQVLLVTDKKFVVGGLVSRSSSRDLGVVRGQEESAELVMNDLSWDADIKEEDTIVTSGLSGNVPKGLPLGEVISVRPDNYGLTQEAILEPFLDLNKLEEVLVVTDFTTKTDISLPPFNIDSSLIEEEQ